MRQKAHDNFQSVMNQISSLKSEAMEAESGCETAQAADADPPLNLPRR